MEKRVSSRMLLAVAAVVVAMVALSACSTKKNTPLSRNYQAFITRYNVYYNGDEHFKETLREMEMKYEDDYSRNLFVHPVEAREHPKSPQPTGNFDRSIEKAQKAIQLHSIKARPKKKSGRGNDAEYKAWLKRSEYNPFIHNAWMMMARSQYFNGDFAGAASTFAYIAKTFRWLPATVTESRLYEALSYCSMDWLFEAETILRRIKPEDLTNKTLRGLYWLASADLAVRRRDWEQAAPTLTEAVKYAHGSQKTRLTFLLGQVYQAMNRPAEAYEAFRKAGSGLSTPYRTKLNARIKQSEVYQGSNIEPEVRALRRMTRYDRNKDYLDQIYYAIGNLYLTRGDTLHAIENYKLAAEKSTRSGIDKALSQLTLGALYFDRREYADAQPCYAEAVPQLPDDYPDRALLKRRSDVLDELAVYSQNVTLQDSLLRLAAMTPEERDKVIEGIIAELKKKEKEEEEAAKREAYLAENEGAGGNLRPQGAGAAPTTFTMNTDDSWYFYNPTAVSAGKTEFQRRWGARKLEDNWRRRNKTIFSSGDFGDTSDEADEETEDETPDDGLTDEEREKEKEAAERAADPHYPEYYLAQIPQTELEKATANDIIIDGLYNMAVILKDKLDDYGAAESEFNTLLTRYPDNVHRLDAYYNMYLMYMRQGATAKAEEMRQTILTEFADSPEGIALQNPDYIENLRRMLRLEEQLYRQAFEAYMTNNNTAVHAAYDRMAADFPLSKLMPKFMFLHALAYVTDNEPEKFNATLKEMLERYPTTEMTPMASAYLKGMAAGRKLHAGDGNKRGLIWDTRLVTVGAAADSTAVAGDGTVEFRLDPSAPHDLVLLYDLGQVDANALLYNVARHNFMTFTVRDFDLDQMAFPPLGLLAVKGFDTEAEARQYLQMLIADPQFVMPEGVRPVVISEANFSAMLKAGASFDSYFEFIGEATEPEEAQGMEPPVSPEEAARLLAEEEKSESEPQEQTAEQETAPDGAADGSEGESGGEIDGWPADVPEPDAAPTVPAEAAEALEPILDAETVATPATPAAPSAPVAPEQPAQPEKPAAPVKPAAPALPAEPEKPAAPVKPAVPDGSEGDDPLLDE